MMRSPPEPSATCTVDLSSAMPVAFDGVSSIEIKTGADGSETSTIGPGSSPLDVLDNPRLTLDKPADDGFDPYNTGAFNRSTSWERIGRQRKR